MFDRPAPGGMLGGLYGMPQVQQLTAPMWDQVMQQPVDAGNAYLAWRQGNLEGLRAAAGGDPQAIGDLAAGFVGGLKVEGPGIIAYHGSPHNFDRFDMSKIGTGEGAQAYGHGLYFAEAEDVAQAYKQMLSRRNIAPTLDGQPITNWDTTLRNLEQQDWRLSKLLGQYGRTGGPLETFIREQRDWYRGDKPMEAAIDQFANRVQSTFTPGSMYQVRINADPATLLDWDKPLSKQSAAVRQALTPEGLGLRPGGPFGERGYYGWYANDQRIGSTMTTKRPPDALFDPRESGQGIYNNIRQREQPAAAGQRLRDAGIPGIQYLDQGSRAAGDGTRNYVIFDDKLIDILKKYGLAGLFGGGAAGAGMLGGGGQQ